jgi:uncharacterized protein (TIGR02145 family)
MRRIFFLIPTLLVLSVANMNAQVRIGSDGAGLISDPHEGAILDLRDANHTPGKGLLLPSVELNDVSVFQLADESTKEDATGMMVYNINPCTVCGIGKGIYVWNGTQWRPMNNSPSSVQDSDGNSYLVAAFGAAGCWMTQNLRTTNGLTAGTHYYYPSSDANFITTPSSEWDSHKEYGLLYDWYTATKRSNYPEVEESNDPDQTVYQGICPAGWHIPSDWEWSQLEDVINKDASGTFSKILATVIPREDLFTFDFTYADFITRNNQENGHGAKMKSSTKVLGASEEPNGMSNPAANNGFDALLVGTTYKIDPSPGIINAIGIYTKFVTSSYGQFKTAFYNNIYYAPLTRSMYFSSNGVMRGQYDISEEYMSVRCKKD